MSIAAPAAAADPGPTRLAGLGRRDVVHDEKFRRLVRERRRLSWSLTSAMLIAYFGFVSTVAFKPDWLGTPIGSGRSTTWGIPVCYGILALAFLLVGVYVRRANTVGDANVAVIKAGDRS
ncbi:DUF485 domain-containing protein [Cupriavidus sp. 8B]